MVFLVRFGRKVASTGRICSASGLLLPKTGFTVREMISAEAVAFLCPRWRCEASGAPRLPCTSGINKHVTFWRMQHFVVPVWAETQLNHARTPSFSGCTERNICLLPRKNVADGERIRLNRQLVFGGPNLVNSREGSPDFVCVRYIH